MSFELLLSTSTCRVLKPTIDKLITKASSWGWCSHLAFSSEELMVGLSTLVTLGSHPEIWTLCTIHKYVFHAFLEDPAIVFPHTITLISLGGALGLFSARWLVQGPLVGLLRPWWTVATSLAWWGLWSAAWGCSTQKCCAHDPGGNISTFF